MQKAKPKNELATAIRGTKTLWHNDEIGVLRTVGSAVCLGEMARNTIHLVECMAHSTPTQSHPQEWVCYLVPDGTPHGLKKTAAFENLEGRVNR